MENAAARGGDGDAMRKPVNYWTCPYYQIKDAHGLRCEGGRLALPSKGAEADYIRTYCADHLGWKRCTVARAITRFYETDGAEK